MDPKFAFSVHTDPGYIHVGDILPPPYAVEAGQQWPGTPKLRHLILKAKKPRRLLTILAVVLLFTIGWPRVIRIVRSGRSNPALGEIESATTADFAIEIDKCAARLHRAAEPDPVTRAENPRWNEAHGQTRKVILRNATLFDGEDWIPTAVDVHLERGLITTVAPAANGELSHVEDEDVTEIHVWGKYVTPGLVDMHSHHFASSWPSYPSTDDVNEISKDFGALTPFVRVIDSLKPYDPAATIIASGGITSSLILPGSANTMGGEATAVKNVLKSGPSGEYVVEELLVERGVPHEDRHRWMKMACGENPKGVYKHTRMGLAWILRKHLSRAKEMSMRQDDWCRRAGFAKSVDDQSELLRHIGKYPEDLELESTIGLIRGQVAMHNHCYEPEDFETMLRVVHEFGIEVKAFHHALQAWQVPKMLKEYAGNVTIATFAEFALYKHESYFPSLKAGAILDSQGLDVAYKSDHFLASTSAKYIMSQAAVGHSFGLSETKAMRSVTSIPARSLDLGFRIGYVRPGYDADIVVWDSHPLSNGATPLQVMIDGVATLNEEQVKAAMGSAVANLSAPDSATVRSPLQRVAVTEQRKLDTCSGFGKDQVIVVTGIRKSFLHNHPQLKSDSSNLQGTNMTLVIQAGKVLCFAGSESCMALIAIDEVEVKKIDLKNGYVTPGLTAFTESLGMSEIATEMSASNGAIEKSGDIEKETSIDYAKYGVFFDGKAFERARLGGVTRAVTPPLQNGGLLRGVSTGIRTSGKKGLLDGGVFAAEVALHLELEGEDPENGAASVGSLSMGVIKIRKILSESQTKGNSSAFGKVAAGLLPLVIRVDSKHQIEQVIAIKQDFPEVQVVLDGAHSAHLVADALASAGISVLLGSNRGGPDTWYRKDALVGPPLTRSLASTLTDADALFGVYVGAAIPSGDSRIHDLALEASWAAKYAGLSEVEAMELVSKNVEMILNLPPSQDIVVWENNPFQFGGTVVLSFDALEDGRLEVGTCWPDESI